MKISTIILAVILALLVNHSLVSSVYAATTNSIETTLSVSAKYSAGKWFDTGVDVQKGHVLSITARGKWRLGRDDNLVSNADGIKWYPRYGDYHYGTLLGRIGNGAKTFKVGTQFKQKMRTTGRLYLINHDTDPRDNTGALKVRIVCENCDDRHYPGADSVRVSVPAKYTVGEKRWFDSGFRIDSQSTLVINARGQWSLGEGDLETDADGLAHYPLFGRFRYGTLMGRVGINGRTFKIGRSLTRYFPTGGRLFLSNNDSFSSDNSGVLNVTIRCQDCTTAIDRNHIEKKFSVSAKQINRADKWFNTNIYVSADALLEVSAEGRWRLGEGNLESDANGLAHLPNNGRFRYGSLLGRIGTHGAVFKVGKNYRQRRPEHGYLFLSNNDTVHYDNTGHLQVRVRCDYCGDGEYPGLDNPYTGGPELIDEGGHKIRKNFRLKSSNISANNSWLDTGLWLRSGSKLKTRARGKWRINAYDAATDAEGNEKYERYNGFFYGTLLGRIGQNGRVFKLGKRYNDKVNRYGRLFLSNNDFSAEDNDGELDIRIECNSCSQDYR